MNLTGTSLAVLFLVSQLNGDSDTTTTTSITTTESVVKEDGTTNVENETSTEVQLDFYVGIRGLYGGSYYDNRYANPKNIHYIHGTYQKSTGNYYKRARYFRDEGTEETLDYYLGFAISKMTDDNFQYEDFHYYYHDINRTISENETVRSDYVIACHPNATSLCPENTETICLRNGTIYCMSKIDVVVPCLHNESIGCVTSTIPCVKACLDTLDNFEEISLPCLSTIVIWDVYEDGRGKTLSRVGGTFILVDALKEKDRTFCVTVIVDPKPKQAGD